jgi:hypothetical protein
MDRADNRRHAQQLHGDRKPRRSDRDGQLDLCDRERAHQRHGLHLHRHGNELERDRASVVAIELGHAVECAGATWSADGGNRDRWECFRIRLLDCPDNRWGARNLYGNGQSGRPDRDGECADHVCDRQWTYERHLLHLHGDGHESRRYGPGVACVELCHSDQRGSPRNPNWGHGDCW